MILIAPGTVATRIAFTAPIEVARGSTVTRIWRFRETSVDVDAFMTLVRKAITTLIYFTDGLRRRCTQMRLKSKRIV